MCRCTGSTPLGVGVCSQTQASIHLCAAWNRLSRPVASGACPAPMHGGPCGPHGQGCAPRRRAVPIRGRFPSSASSRLQKRRPKFIERKATPEEHRERKLPPGRVPALSRGAGTRGLRPPAACLGEGQKKSDLKIILLVFSSVNGPGFVSPQTRRNCMARSRSKRRLHTPGLASALLVGSTGRRQLAGMSFLQQKLSPSIPRSSGSKQVFLRRVNIVGLASSEQSLLFETFGPIYGVMSSRVRARVVLGDARPQPRGRRRRGCAGSQPESSGNGEIQQTGPQASTPFLSGRVRDEGSSAPGKGGCRDASGCSGQHTRLDESHTRV